jgi:hypothetical protein
MRMIIAKLPKALISELGTSFKDRNFSVKDLQQLWYYHKERISSLWHVQQIIGTHVNALEIGVWMGEHAFLINGILRPKKLVLLDTWGHDGIDPPGINVPWDTIFKNVQSTFAALHNVEIIRSSSSAAHATFKDEMFDYIYIDADYSYEATKKDLENFFPKLRPGGIIAGNAYYQNFFDNIGVSKAVDEFRDKNKDKIRDFRTFGSIWNRSWLVETIPAPDKILGSNND